jgi:uncharacterized protein involved in outer membrane biogenesis
MVQKLRDFYAEKIRPRAKKTVAGLLIFFFVFTLAGFFLLPPLLKSVLINRLSGHLHREVSIREIKINPYTFSVTARDLVVKERGSAETFVSCEEIFLNLQALSVLRMALVFKEIRLNTPYIKLMRNKDLSYNLSDLIQDKQPGTGRKEKQTPFRFYLNNIRIENGSIDFLDAPRQTRHTVRDLKLGIPFLSSIPSHVDIFVQPQFSARINDTLYTIQGKTKPFSDSLETSVDIDINDINVPHYLAYIPTKTAFKITSAFLDTRVKLSFVQTKKRESSLTIEGNVALKKIAVDDEKDNALFRLPLLDVSIASSEPLSKIIHLSRVSVQSPELQIRRNEEGSVNLQSLLEREKEVQPTPETGESAPLVLDIDRIDLAGGKISFSDLSETRPFTTILHPIDLKVEGFSNTKDRKSMFMLSAATEAKEGIKAEGRFSLQTLDSEGVLSVTSVSLKKYDPFYSRKVLFAVDHGRLDFSARYRYARGEKEPEIRLSAISTAITALRLTKSGEKETFLNIPDLSLTDTDLDFTKRELQIGNVSTRKGEVIVKRTEHGLNLSSLFPAEPTAEKQPLPRPATPEKRWNVSLKQALADNYTIRFEDHTTPDPIILTAASLKLKAENISTFRNSRGKIMLSLLLNGKGAVSAAGSIGIEPLAADLKTEMREVEIGPFQPYFSKKVNMAVTGGTFSTAGHLLFAFNDKNQLSAGYKGRAGLDNFSSIDKVNGNDLLKLESLSLSDLAVGYDPFSIHAKGISLTNFYALVLVRRNGRINLQEMFAVQEKKADPPFASQQLVPVPVQEEKSTARNIKIDEVTLQGGRIDFVDRAVKPEFSTRLSEIGGRVSGLSAEENINADVELLTKLNEYTPLEITGKINPFSRDLFVNLKARVKDFDLSPATPYAGKYAGYMIEKGKLSLDLQYLISKGKLDSQNNIFIDQFTFGEKVDSPAATNLPVKLAVALLKDRNGQIKLDLPVTGSLGDPQFSVWRIIVKILTNLIAKAATSPFALLGSVFGGGEELSYIVFDYGNSLIPVADMKKLEAVTAALHDRPSLKMDIEGHVDMEKDKEGLKQLFFNRKIKVQKLKEFIKKGQAVPPVDEVKIEPGEYAKYLKMAYKEEKFPKPKNVLGLAKDIPVAEMEKLMMTHTAVREGNLRTLASERAVKVRDFILKSGQVEPERLFIVEPKSLQPEKKEKTKESRVDFKLK